MKKLIILLMLLAGCSKAPLQVGHCYDKAGIKFKVKDIKGDTVLADVLQTFDILGLPIEIALEATASKAALTKDLSDLKEIKCEGELK